MTIVKITGNTQFIDAAANVISLANTFGANSTQGATSVYIYNSNTSVQVLTLANSQGSFTFTIPPSTEIVLQKNASDTLQCAANSSNGFLYANPMARIPD